MIFEKVIGCIRLKRIDNFRQGTTKFILDSIANRRLGNEVGRKRGGAIVESRTRRTGRTEWTGNWIPGQARNDMDKHGQVRTDADEHRQDGRNGRGGR